MLIYLGGNLVGKGTYWNATNGHSIAVKDTVKLPGSAGTHYIRLHPLGVIFLAPVFGLLYILFLPLFSLGTALLVAAFALLGAIWSVAIAGIRACSMGFGHNLGWRPSTSYLVYKKRTHKARKKTLGKRR